MILRSFFVIAIVSILVSCVSQPKDPNWSELLGKLKAGLFTKEYNKPHGKLFEVEKATQSKESWCFVGDSGVEGVAQENVSSLLIRPKNNCDRIYHLGDLVYPTGIVSKNDPNLSKRFLNYHFPFEKPFFFVLGDHEYYGLSISPWIEVANSHNNLNFPYYYYGHNSGGICVVAGDTTPFYRGNLSDPKPSAQMRWFQKEIPKFLRGCRFKIFIAHHSYETMNTSRKPPQKAYKTALRTFFEKAILGKFDLIVSGHDHALAYVGNFNGTDQFISGAGGKYTKASENRMDLKNYKGHKGPGLLRLEIESRTPFRGEAKIFALEGANLDQKKLVFSKKYRK